MRYLIPVLLLASACAPTLVVAPVDASALTAPFPDFVPFNQLGTPAAGTNPAAALQTEADALRSDAEALRKM